MPILDERFPSVPLSVVPELDYFAAEAATDAPPSFTETLGAAFQRSNVVGSIASNKLLGIDPFEKEEGFTGSTIWDEIKDTKYESQWQRFADIHNRRAFNAMRAQLDMEEDNNRTLAAAGWAGTGAEMFASVVDLPSLIPGGTLVRGATVGATALRTGVTTAAAGALAASVSEIGLQASQQTRTLEESLTNVGAATILSGALGAGVGAFFSRAERNAAFQAVERAKNPAFDAETDQLHSELTALTSSPHSAGAAAREMDSLEDLSIAGASASRVAKATAQLNPLLRTMHSPSRTVRSIASRLMDTPVYLKKNLRGYGDIAAETAIHQYARGGVVQALEKQRAAFLEARKAGSDLTEAEFRQAVGYAMRRDDISNITGVAAAASAWRKHVIEPLKDRAIAAGLLPEDVSVSTAQSYFTRVYNRPKIEANEGEFKAIVRNWVTGTLDNVLNGNKGLKADDFVSEADRLAYVEEIVDDIYAKVTGRMYDGDVPSFISIKARGPLRERTFSIADELIEPFLESDAEVVGRRYARIMAADIELTERFGSPDMEDAFIEVASEYSALREKVANDPSLEGSAKKKELQRLNKQERADFRDLKGVRDLLRGHYRPDIQHTTWARIGRAANTFNYMRALGGVLIASLTDAVRPAMVHGLKAYTQDAIIPLVRNTAGVKLSVGEAKLAGAVAERWLSSRLATLAEITDPYAVGSPFERFLDNAASGFSRMTGLQHWNDFQKGLTAVLTQNRILKNAEIAATKGFDALPAGEQAYMGFLGIGRGRAEDIGKRFASVGATLDGVRIANTEQWGGDPLSAGLVRAYRTAVNKDVDSIIVTKGAGDVPLLANTPLGRALLQFKSFAIASNQRVLLRGLQEDKARFVGGMVGMTTIGMFIYFLKQLESGRDISNNPGTWVAEGLDRSGIFSVAFEINNALEKANAPGAFTAAAAAGKLINPSADGRQPASRFAVRSTVGSLLGPSFGGATDTVTLLGAGFQNARNLTAGEPAEISSGDITAMRRLTPFASLPYWRWALDGFLIPEIKESVSE